MCLDFNFIMYLLVSSNYDAALFPDSSSHMTNTLNIHSSGTNIDNHPSYVNIIKKHICPTCHKVYVKKSSLSKHPMLHEDIYAFFCDLSIALFNSLVKLTKYGKTHSETSVNLFSCDVCVWLYTYSHKLTYLLSMC